MGQRRSGRTDGARGSLIKAIEQGRETKMPRLDVDYEVGARGVQNAELEVEQRIRGICEADEEGHDFGIPRARKGETGKLGFGCTTHRAKMNG